jgi:hypothetical protein
MYPSDEPKKRKPRHKQSKKGSLTMLKKLGLFCRSVGPGGTDVDFYAVNGTDKIFAVFSHENCPYSKEGEYDPNTNMAHDGHNVVKLSKKALMEELEGL